MNLQSKCVDGELQIHDHDTDALDLVAIVPLTGDTDYDNSVVVPFARLICAAPRLLTSLGDLLDRLNDVAEVTQNARCDLEKEDSYWVAGNITNTVVAQARAVVEEVIGEAD